MKARKIIALLTSFFLSTMSLLSQSYLIPIDAPTNKYPITFTDAAQQTLVLEFDRAVTAPGTSAGWTITVGGVAVAMSGSPVMAGNFLRITLPVSIPYANRTTVLVSYNAAVGTMSLTGPVEPTMTNIQAVNNYIGVQADFSNGLYGENPPVDICAAVQNVEITSNITVSARFRNSIHFRTPRMYTLWMFPAASPKTDPNYIETGVGSGIFSATQNYAGYPDNTTNCTWQISVYPFVLGAAPQPILNVTNNQVFITIPNYKKDNGTPVPGTGDLGLNPPVDDPRTLFCVGENITAFIFTDATVFDCQLAVEPNLPNTRTRYAQYVYGTHIAAGIPNVYIDVFGSMVQVTDNNGVGIQGTWHVNPDGTPNVPGYTTPSGYFEGPVTQYLWDAGTKTLITPMITTYPIYHTGSYVNDMENDIFDVTLRNWGPCNPYDAFDPLTYLQAVTEFSRLRLVGAPPIPTAPDVTICSGGSTTLSATRNGLNPGILHWYNNSDLLPIHEVGTGASYNPGALAAGIYNYWVREIGTTGLLCEGPAEQVTLTIRETLTQPGVITGPAQVCSNQAGINFSVVANPPVMPFGGATRYTWSVPAGWTITGGQGTRQITVTTDVSSGSKTISLVTDYLTAPACSSPSRSTTTNQNPIATINSAATKTVCDITPLAYTATSATAGCTFAWTRAAVAGISNAASAGATALINESLDNTTTAPVNAIYIITPTINGCVGTPFTLTVTINPTAVITSAATKTVCDVIPLAYTSTSSTAGATFAWTRAAVAGIANAAASGAAALINESLDNTTAAAVNATYIITPSYGGCAGTPFTLTVTVQPRAVITSAATKTICDNASTAYTIASSTAGATFAWTRAAVAGIANVAGSGTGANINENLDNTATGSRNVTYVITPTYAGCTGTAFNLVVTVQPTAVITSVATRTGCDVIPLAYTATSSTAGATFAWTRAAVAGILNAASSGAAALINESLDNTTTAPVNVIYVITPSAGGCAGTPFSLTVTVNPRAVITSAAALTICDNTSTGYTATSSTAGATFAWTRAVVAGISNAAAVGATSAINENLDNTTTAPVNVTYVITPSYGGCAGTPFSLVVTVNPTPTINSAATKTVCDVTPLAYTATSATAGATFAWTRAAVAGISNGAGAGATALINESLDNTTTAPVTATYIITPSLGACAGTPFNLVVTVNPTAVITSAATRTVCSNTALGYTATSSTAGATFAWTRAAVAGITNPAGGGATSGINESLINTSAVDVNAIYVITPSFGVCAGTPFTLTVTVHPQFTLAQLHDDLSICNNTAADFNIAMTGGTSPYTVNYTRNGVAQAVLNNYVSGTNVTTGVLTTGSYVYALTSVTDAFGCPVQSLGISITVTVGSALTGATLTGSGDACFGASSTIRSVITGGAPPYTLVITGYAGSPVAGYTSGTNLNLGAMAVGPHSYTLTSVTDACGNIITPGAAYIINITGIPDAAATVNNTPSICNNGTTDIVLHADVASSDFIWTVSNAPAVVWQAGKAPAAGTRLAGEGTSIAQNLAHNGTDLTTVTYTITPRGPGATACLGTPVTRTVIVYPTAVVTSAAAKTICDNASTAYTATSSTTGATFSWTRAAVAGITNAAGGGATSAINENLDNSTAAPVNVTYVITPAAGGCPGTPFNLVVTVNPTAVITSAAAKTICDNASTAYTATSSTAGATFAWTRAAVAGISNAASSGATSAINETLDNTTTAPVNVTYVITPSFGGCAGTPFSFVVTVNPTAVVNSAAAQTVCDITPLAYTATSSTAGATFAWTRAAVAGISNAASGGATALINESLDNTTTAPVNATYIITPSIGGCAGTPFSLVVTVNPTAVITSAAAKTICDNASTAYTATSSTAGATFAWTRAAVAGIANAAGGGATSAINENLDNTSTAPVNVTYVITPSSGGCAGTPFNLVVTVNPTAVITSLAARTVCDITPLAYTATSSTAGATFAWTRAAVAGISNAASGGATALINESLDNTTTAPVNATYIITPSYGVCAGTPFSLVVTVNPTAVITSAAAKTICDNASTAYTATSSTAGATFAWTRAAVAGIANVAGGGATSAINENLDNTSTAPVNVTYVITPSYGGCAGTPFSLVVTVNPTAVITSAAARTVCDVTPLAYTATSSTAGTTFAWTRAAVAGISNAAGGGATALINESLDNSTTAPVNATYIITPTYGGCAGTPFSLVVTVNPTAVITSAAAASICDNVALNYTATSSTAGATFAWTRAAVVGIANAAGAGATALISEALDNSTSAPVNVTYVITPGYGGCAGTPFNFIVTVNPTPALSSTLTPAAICSNTLFSYAPASGTGGTTFNWTRATVAGITPAGPASGTNNPGETLRNITSAPIVVTYQYTLAANGCSNVQNVVVTINPEPVITAGQNTAACSGNALNYRILMNNFVNPGDNVTFTWPVPVLNPINVNFSGGSARGSASAANITDTFVNTMGGLGTATYTVTPHYNGCAGIPVSVVITVGSEPVLDPGLNAFACSNSPIGLILKEAAGSVVPTYYNIISKTVSAGLTDAGNAAIPNATAPANYLSADHFTNMTGVNRTVTYRISPILAPNCIGAAVDVVITIRPQPVIMPAQTKTVCSGVAIGREIILVPANTPAGTLFSWPVPVLSDASVQGTSGTNVAADPLGTIHINDAINNYSSAPITATYTITPVSSFGCAGAATPAIIIINPEPIPQPISGRDKICVTDRNVVYNVTAVSGSTFHWTVDAAVGTKTFDFNSNAILVDAAAVAGTGNITVYETNSYTCSGDISTLPVQVYSFPAPENIIGPAVVCTNSTQVYSVTNRAGSSYSWTIPGGTAIVGNPSASSITLIFANVGGTISVRETNAAGCITNHNPFAVSVNPLPTATISGGGTICDGASRNLTVDFTGTGPYSFTYALNGVPQAPVSTAADPYTLNVTLPGTYTIVNVSDANCTNAGTGTTTVSYFPKPTGIISGTTEICRGSSTTLTATFTGTAPFTFTYTDGTTPVTVTGHLTNVYTTNVSPTVNSTYTLISLTDGNSCTGVLSGNAVITVNQPPALSLSGTNLICYNVSTGAVNMTITGGTAPFGITWTGPDSYTASSEDISGRAEGYYAVTVLDSKGCSATANITLTQPPVLNGSAAGTNITCFGAADGTITISGATGGAGTHEFSVNGGGSWQASPSFNGLVPGTYNVIMRDVANPTCMLTLNGSLLITQPAVLNATVVSTDVNCFGANNGTILISAPTGGYGTYGYSIDGGATWQGSGNFTNLAPGNYNVRIRDAAHTACDIALASPTLTEPDVLTATVNSTNITCFGSTDGSITISAPAGGHGTYEYSINGGGSWQNTGSFTNLAPGTYNVQIRDAAYTGCYIVLNGALVVTQPAVLAASVASTNISCNSASDGIISITAPTGGYGTFEYSINGGTLWQAAGLFNGLAPGTYDVRIRDAANTACVIILNAGLQITQPAAISGLVIDTDITCFGANDGIININNSAGGYGTYQYTINGGTAWQDSPAFSGLLPGTYDVRIRDRAHIACVATLDAAVVISQPAVLNATVASTNVTCFGTGDGTITISSPTGGYGSYGYSINGGTSWQGSGNFTNLVPGTYNIRIRDAVHTGCIIALNPPMVITQPAVLSASVVRTNVTCNGAADGTITINGATGGYGTYEYTVNGGIAWQSSNIFTGLIPGFYNVQIRDAANPACIITVNGSVNITEPQALNAIIARTNVTCNGAANGTITVSSPSGGYGTYQYSINGGGSWQASGSFTALAPAIYNVQIRDAAQPACVITLNGALSITEPAILAATVTPTNVSCFGANNGIITVTGASGGYGTYEYSINGGTTWSGLGNFTNLAPATYDIRIRDAANAACVITLNGAVVITQPAVLTATVVRTNLTCFGAGDGTVTISAPAGGYGTYEYSINGGGSWQASGSFTALGPGNYNVQIRDAAHTSCVIVLNNALQITQPAVLNAAVTTTNVTCNGANDGIISVTAPTGGFGTYEYSNNGGVTWQGAGLFIGLAPAIYDVRIRDAVNIACVIVLNNALSVTEPAVLSANVLSTNVTCFGSNNGTITINNPAGGYGTYEYSRNGGTTWQATGTFINLVPGSYDVRIRDRAHIACVIILNPALVITQPAILSGTVASTNVTCFGANNGTITITNPLGGYGTYSYSINGGTTWQGSGIFSGLSPATYNVRIRDAANTTCEIILNAALVITQPAVLAGTVASTNVTCNGANDGTISISSLVGGYGTYEYSVNGGGTWQASGNFTALSPGFYNVQIRDAANTGCVITLNSSLRITEPNTLSANIASTNVTCNGAGDGTITLTSPSGGYGTYQYSINAGGSWQASGSFSSLIPGTYNVQIRDAAHTGCVIVLNAALVITQPAVLGATVTPVNVTCNGANDGIINISAPTGGYGSYQYTINGGTTWSGSGTFTNLAPATYNVRMRDAANPACVLVLNAALIITQPAVLSATVAKTDVTCFGGSDGTITISAPLGGYGTYEYSINGGGSWQASGSFTALVPGNYNVRIRDAAHTGCVIILNNSLAITQPAILNAVVTPTNVSCNGANDGIINITAPAGGYGTYQYSINGGTGWQASGNFTALIPGIYDVRIRDAAHTACEIILNGSLTITEPAVLSAAVTSANVTCFGANNGTITISSPAGGYGTYEYSVSGGTAWQVTGTFTNLVPGSYDVRIRDRAHTACVIILNPALVITQPAILSATVASANVTCFGANNGTITITNPLGGYGTYSYSINGGTTWQGSGSFSSLAPATYNVRIRDAANISCEIVLNAAVIITQPPVLSATVASTNVTCFGTGDGTITITNPLGGYGTYEYSVNGGTTWQASGSFTALLPGFYNVQIRDAANTGCVITLNSSLRITEPSVLTANVISTNVTCNGANDGTITISSPGGGYGTYQYSINAGVSWQASGSFTALVPATYNVQIRDAAHTGCVIILNATLVITQPVVLSATVTPTNVTCFGANDGIISVTAPAGGYGTYQYSINGGTTWQGTGTFTNLTPGNYDVRIRDAAHIACVIILNPATPVTQPAVLSATVAKTDVTCFGGSDGTITISAPLGGYGTYEYSINGGGSWQASGSFTALVPGNYNVRIRDAAHTGCVIILNNSLAITQPAILNAVVTPTNVSCNGANDGIINITAPAGGYGTYQYSINGGTGWQASGNFTALIPGIYDVRIRDAAHTACEIILNGSLTITEPAVLSAAVTSANVTCFGANNGTITVSSPAGGYGTYEYSVSGGTAWQVTGTFTNLVPGSYDVRIRDRAHTACVIILNPALVITQPAILSGTVFRTNVTCFGANNGTITITNPFGGYGTYGYSINGGTSWQATGVFTGLAPATYNVRIRDAANISCEIVLNAAVVVTQPPVLSATVASTNVACFSAGDGTITITNPLGGYGTYEYSVNGGTTWQASGNFTALLPGFYNVQIRDAANPGCVIILNSSLRITEPPVLAAVVSGTNVTCNGANDGIITIFGPTGGYGTYQYSINGGGSWQASGSFSSLSPGTYNVQIRDAAHTGCVIVLNAALVITQPAVLSATVTPTMVTCFNASNGIITITNPAGGYGTYQYSINGGTTWQGSGTFTNLAPAVYNVRIRDAANTGCVIILNPALSITQPAVLSASITSTNVTCFGGNDGTITISGAAGGYGTYEYSINGGGSWQASGTFAGLTNGSYNILIRDAAHSGCVIVLNSAYSVTQPGLLTATVTKVDVTCNGANDGTISITASSGGYGTYEYSISGGASWQPSGTYLNLVPGTYDVRIRDAAHPACSVILYPNLVITEPVILAMTNTGNILLNCFGDNNGTGTFYASGGTMPYTFTVVTNTAGATISFPGFNSQTFFGAGAGTVTVNVRDQKGCFAQASIVVSQPLLLTPGIIAANQVICSGSNPAQLTESVAASGGPAAYVYQWQYGSTALGPFINIAGANASQYTPVAAATTTLYYRRMVTSGLCAPVYSNVIEIRVNPNPLAILSGGETICPSQTSVLKVNMMVGTGPFELDIENHGTITGYVSGSDIVVSPASTTTYRLLRVRDANNCEILSPSANLIGSATVTVRALPAITVQPVSRTTCEFGIITYGVTATGTDLTYQWYVNEGSGFNPVTDGGIYFGATASTLNLFGALRVMNGYVYHVVVNGCSTSVTSSDANLTVNTPPEIVTQPRDSTICMNAAATFNVTAIGTNIAYQWQVNRGAGFVNVVNDANFSGSNLSTLTITNTPGTFNNYIFRVIISGTCGVPVYTNFAVLRVNNPPVVTLNPVNRAICDGSGPVLFSANGSGLIDSLRWQVFSGGVWSDIYDSPVYSGTTSQQLTLSVAPFALNGNQYRLSLKAKCTIVYTNNATLTVYPNPVVDFSAVDPIHACGGVPLVINGNPSGGSGIWASHLWTGDVGPLNNYYIQAPSFNSQIAGTYVLNYQVRDSRGCIANDDVSVVVDAPDATFAWDINSGCTPATISFSKDVTGISKFWWDFDDGSPIDSVNANPVHQFTNISASAIEYRDVKLTVRSLGGCLDTYNAMITIYPSIDATFTVSTDTICSGNAISFTALTGASKYFWDYGDGPSGYATHNTSHIYTNLTTVPVVRTVTLTTTSFYNCTDVKTLDIVVMPVPLPQFSANPPTQVFNAAGNPVVFTNETNAGTWNWLWTFGDGNSSTVQDPTNNYSNVGTFTVTLRASNSNCTESISHEVRVTEIPPVADFDTLLSGCEPLALTINNTSLNTEIPGTTYKWEFGDGSTSTAKNPTYTYFDAGIYRVELTVTGPGGTSVKSQVVNVYASPKAYFEVSPTTVFVNDEKIRCFNLSEGASYYLWDFGDGDTSKVAEPYHKYMEEGVYDIILWAYSENGCSDRYLLSPGVTVEPAGDLRFSTVFTPNKDGEIDMDHLPTGGTEIDQFFFPPIRVKVNKYQLQIFNRLGVLIFETHDINKPWNGYYKNQLCPQGVYVWYVEGKYENGEPFKKVGDVTLLH